MLLPLLGGLAAGALLVWLYCRSRERELNARLEERGREAQRLTRDAAAGAEARERVGRLEAELAAERRGGEEKLAVLRDAEIKLREAFTALSSDALKANNEQFLQLATASLTAFRRRRRPTSTPGPRLSPTSSRQWKRGPSSGD